GEAARGVAWGRGGGARGGESTGAELASVRVDPARPPLELVAVAEQEPVVVQIVDVDLESPAMDLVEVARRNLVATLGDDLERRLHAVRVVRIHQPVAGLEPRGGLPVGRENDAARRALRPEPYERQPIDTLATQRQKDEPLEDPLHGVVDRPTREGPGLPVAEIGSLERAPEARWDEP